MSVTMHLRKANNGHLLKNSAGQLVKSCVLPIENNCNSCDPPIPDILYMTFSGLGGDFAALNGTHALEWLSGCGWKKDVSGGYLFLNVRYVSNPPYSYYEWFASINIPYPGCERAWRLARLGDAVKCDPTQTFELYNCDDWACANTNSCPESSGSTVSISLTPP